MKVEGDLGDQVILTDFPDWVRTPHDMVDGNTYNVWNHTSPPAQLLIDTRVIVA